MAPSFGLQVKNPRQFEVQEIIGGISYNNDNPTEALASLGGKNTMRVTNIQGDVVSMGHASANYDRPFYIGFLYRVSDGRVLWVNDSGPLP